ncbi:hypothetical protein ANAPC2_01422 [Anaplasma phagocytophilum]|nr:hypothetical protein ANAPC2_01422 [Anaplasma phagocytophilum]
MNGKITIDIYTLPCVKQIASGKLLYSTGCSAQYWLCGDLEGRVGGKGGPRGRGCMYMYS